AGLGASSYLAAIEAGVDTVETSIVPFANGTSQPDTARMLALLDGHPRRPDFDPAKLQELRVYFEDVYRQLAKFTSPANERVDSDILVYQVPGGMLSNFRNQLVEQGMADKFDEVVREIPVVREALGWIPLVTPTSQIVGTQAMMNVKFGRWKMICQPAQDIALGKYGKTPGEINPEVLAKVEKDTGKKRVTERPADLLDPGLENYRQQAAAKGLPTDDEMVVLFAMFPQQVEELVKGPKEKPAPEPAKPAPEPAPAVAAPAPAAPAPAPVATSGGGKQFALVIDGERHLVTVEPVN
ncbi:MAG: pyruvate carboxyltransferase, partial [Akkermansiaceae bacterium]|nr:pyruvate carboxyltransferase [Akkermansiaceae bacterium]